MIEIIIALFLFFRQAAHYLGGDPQSSLLLGGNLDPFFILGVIGLYSAVKYRDLNFIQLASVILAIGVLQILFPIQIHLLDWAVNLTKLVLCIAIMYLSRRAFLALKLGKIVVVFSALVTAGLALALSMNQSDLLWTLNDGVNKFDLTRLKLTFLEPSELGFTLMIVIITSIYLFCSARSKRAKTLYAACIAINTITLFHAKPLGAIAIGLIAIIVMTCFQIFYAKPSIRNQFTAWMLVVIAVITSLTYQTFNSASLESVDNSLIQRGIYAAEGNDSSINYRVGISLKVATSSLIQAPLTGTGLGNSGSDNFIEQYRHLGLSTPPVNSYLGFIAEAGVIGLLFVVYIITSMYRSAFRAKSYYAIGIVTFIIIYQFAGSHFSNPLTWSLYGAVLAIATRHKTPTVSSVRIEKNEQAKAAS